MPCIYAATIITRQHVGHCRGRCVHLKIPSIDDLAFIRKLWTDEATMATVGGIVATSREQAEKWYARVVFPGSASNCFFLIFDYAKTTKITCNQLIEGAIFIDITKNNMEVDEDLCIASRLKRNNNILIDKSLLTVAKSSL